jgi:hypothetical protein
MAQATYDIITVGGGLGGSTLAKVSWLSVVHVSSCWSASDSFGIGYAAR